MLQNFAPNPYAHIVQYLFDSGQIESDSFAAWPEDDDVAGACAKAVQQALAVQGMQVKLYPFGKGSFPALGLDDGYLGIIAVCDDDGAVPIMAWEPWLEAMNRDEESANTALFSDILVLRLERDGDEMELLDVESGKLWDFAGMGDGGSLLVPAVHVMSRDTIGILGEARAFHNEYELLQAAKITIGQEKGFDYAEEWHKRASMYAAPYMRF